METGFNPVYPDPDFSLVNVALQSPTDQDAQLQGTPASPAHEEDIPQIAYEGDEAKGPDVSTSLATHVEGCMTEKIKKDDMEAYLKRFLAHGNCPSLRSPLMDHGSCGHNLSVDRVHNTRPFLFNLFNVGYYFTLLVFNSLFIFSFLPGSRSACYQPFSLA